MSTCPAQWPRRPNHINDLTDPGRRAAYDTHEKGQLAEWVIQTAEFSWKNGWAEGWAWLRATEDLYFFERVKVWSYKFRCGLDPGELAADLAAAEIGEKLRAYEAGAAVLVRLHQMATALAEVRARIEQVEHRVMVDHISFEGSIGWP